jgi:serine/threonine protein kinase
MSGTRTLADALAFMHARGVIHADLKLENLFLTEDDTIKAPSPKENRSPSGGSRQ